MTIEIKHDLRSAHLGTRLILGGKPYVGGLCLHDTAGSGTHNDTRYLSHPGDGRKVSVDFTVERNGDVYQLNPDLVRKCTFHAGRATKWKTGGRNFRNYEVTQVLIGIELCQKADMSLVPAWPVEQVAAVAELCVWLCGKFQLTKEQITTHAAIIQDGSRTDPRRFIWDSFWFHFNRAANTPAIDPRPNPDGIGSPIYHAVVAGDTLFSIARRYKKSIEELKAINGMSTPSVLIKVGDRLIIQR
jgi:hypothetical protein